MATYVVIGAPGAGKGTRIEMAKEVIPNLVSISTGNLLRKRGVDTSHGGLVQNDLIMELLGEELYSLETDVVILDGVPRNVEQAELMKKYGINVHRVIHLSLKEETAVKRALDRIVCSNCPESYTNSDFKPPKVKGKCDKCGADLIKRPDDNEETIKKRMMVYREETEPVLSWYKSEGVPIITVDSENDLTDFIEALKD